MSFVIMMLLSTAWSKPPVAPPAPPAPVVEEGPRTVTTKADLSDAKGVRATVLGSLERRKPEGEEATGTAIVLDDGTAVYVSQGDPPSGWEWMLGTRVRVQGQLWSEGAPSGWKLPTLSSPEAPMPADGGMPTF